MLARAPTIARALLAAAALLAACALPEGDRSTPSGALYQWLQVRAAGDSAAMWEMLDPAARAEFDRWVLVEKLTLNEIKTAYPRGDMDAALAAIDGGKRGELADGKALFALYLAETTPEAVGGLAALGARVSDEVLSDDGNEATLRTYGGGEVRVVKGADGQWSIKLPEDEWERLRNARVRAEQNLERVKNNLKKLGRQGG